MNSDVVCQIRQIHTDSLACEPILRRMPSGDLICVAQCGDVTEPAPGNRVYVYRSEDNGQTWSDGELIRSEDEKAVYVTEVSVIGNKSIAYLTVHNGNFADWKSERMLSTDNGVTWVSIGPLPGYETFTFPRGMIRLTDGRLCMACQHYPISEEENRRLVNENLKVWAADIDYVENDLLFSSDEGETWVTYHGPKISLYRNEKKKWVWSEPTIIELKSGNIAMMLRVCGSGRLYYAEFSSAGLLISDAKPTDIPNPGNKPKLIRLSDDRIGLLHTPCETQRFIGRNPLSLWISHNELLSFDEKHVISDFPGAFCYPDGICEGNKILFSIEHNRHTILYIDVDAGE